MRQKERLSTLWKFMKTPRNILKYLTDIVKLDKELAKKVQAKFIENYKELKQFHKENVDLRFSQVLQHHIIYAPGFWFYKEDEDILIELGIEVRKVLLWGQNYDKNMNRLKKTKWVPIFKLNTDHIEAILDGEYTKNPEYIEAFKSELKWREA